MFFSKFKKFSPEDAPRKHTPSGTQSGPKSLPSRIIAWIRRCFRRTHKEAPSPQPSRKTPTSTFQGHSVAKSNSGSTRCWSWKCFRRTHKVAPQPLVKPAKPPRQTELEPLLKEDTISISPNRLAKGEPGSKVQSQPNGKRVDLVRRGLPNGGNTCYQNACLQMLRTAEPFISSLSSQETVWRSCDEAVLLRHIHAIAEAPYTPGPVDTYELLHNFKQAVAIADPKFGDFEQQDAHEFLMLLLEQVQSFTPILQVFAFGLEVPYMCPVEEHIMFHMENIRTCRGCGMGSSRREAFTVLSLDLFPGWSIEKLLDHHLKETELMFKCDCGSSLSSQTTAFSTLPNILMLHLKRFKYDSQYMLEKVDDPVKLDRSIVLKTGQATQRFNLSSIISHLGSSANSGHYINDGVDLEDKSLSSDKWLTYNDDFVSRSTRQDCCRKRKRTAYMLMYQRQV